MTHDRPHRDEQRLADLELRTEQERATFDLYEHRRLAVETQATALTAAALTVGGLLLLGFEDLSGLGDVPEWGVPVALVGLIWALVCASLARFGSWDTPKKYGGPKEAYHGEVKRTLDALRDATEETEPVGLRRLARAHWNARAESAWKLGEFKFKRLRLGLWGLAVAAAYLLLVAGALLAQAVDNDDKPAGRDNAGATHQPETAANARGRETTNPPLFSGIRDQP